MRLPYLYTGFVLGFAAGALLCRLLEAPPLAPLVPAAGILEGWVVVRDDETVLCESPAIFVRARQIECP